MSFSITSFSSGNGLVADVCLKRKIRDYAAPVGQEPIFIQSQTASRRPKGRKN